MECWHVAGKFTHGNDGISEDTRYKIAFSLWKEGADLDGPDMKDLTTQDSGPPAHVKEGPLFTDDADDIPF